MEQGRFRGCNTRRSILDYSLAAEELGWKPRTHLEDGLGETVAYMKGV